MFWETQGGRSIKQGRKKGEHSLRRTGSFVGGAWQRQGLPCEEELDDSQEHGYSPLAPTSCLSAKENADAGHSEQGVQLLHSERFAATFGKGLFSRLVSQHSCRVSMYVLGGVLSQACSVSVTFPR